MQQSKLSPPGHLQYRGDDSFDCCTERYEIVVLLPNSEHTKGNNIKYNLHDADARTVRLHRKMFSYNGGYGVQFGHLKLLLTSLFVVRKFKSGCSLS